MSASPRAHFLLVGLVSVIAVIIGVVLVVVGVPWWLSLIIVVGLAAAAASAVVRAAPSLVLGHLRAVPLDDRREHERLVHLVEGLCLATGVRVPDLAVVDDDAPNGMVVGRSSDDATVVVTRGLVERLGRTELEGVIAHLLSRLRSPRLGDETLAALVIGRALAPVPVVQRRALAWVVDEHPSVRADRDAVAMTRYPPGLAAALVTIDAAGGSLRFGGRATRHLWLDDPVRSADDAVDIPLVERIDVLQEL